MGAGYSRRMGEPKLILPFRDKSILRNVIEQALASHIDGLVLVLNPSTANLISEKELRGVNKIVINEKAKQGMSTSVKLGLKSLPKEVESVIFLLGDQPLISSKEINTLIKDHQEYPNYKIVQSSYHGSVGHPILFRKEMLPLFFGIDGDEGGRSILKKYRQDIFYSEMNRELIRDVDTPEDYKSLLKIERHLVEK